MGHVVIIGNGIAGITTARNIRKNSSERITIVSGETEHFFSRTALMYIYMGHMKFEHTKPYEDSFWKKNNLDIVKDWVSKIDFEKKEVLFSQGGSMAYDRLVLATGSRPNKFGWPGQDLPGVQGLYSYQDLELLQKNSQGVDRAVIVGGGLIGVELAEMLLSRGIKVTFLVREAGFWSNVLPLQEAKLIGRHLTEHHVDLRLETELAEIKAGASNRVSSIITKSGDEIPCQLVGLTVGVSPNIDFLKGSALETNRGILVSTTLETNISNVYAVGDCVEFREPVNGRRSIEQVWYTGRIMGETLAKTLCGNVTEYNPGPWFNSAKFFDIEYQTYGWVFPKLRNGEEDFYWEDSTGKVCLHIVFDAQTRRFIGLNSFGIRLRHHVFDSWLRSGKTVEHVLEHLKDANFDPEFYKQYEQEIVNAYNVKFDVKLGAKKMSWSRILEILN